MKSAKTATRISPPRITRASSGASRRALTIARSARSARPAVAALRATTVAMPRLPRQPDARVDEGVEDVHDQVDTHDHEAGHHHHALHERKVALEDALVEQAPDARPREDDLDDDGGVDHHHE